MISGKLELHRGLKAKNKKKAKKSLENLPLYLVDATNVRVITRIT